MFRAEDPLNFTYRVMDAVVRRRHTEKLIKFNIYCDCMPLTGIDDLNSDSMNRIYKSVTRNGYLKGVEETLALVSSSPLFHSSLYPMFPFHLCEVFLFVLPFYVSSWEMTFKTNTKEIWPPLVSGT